MGEMEETQRRDPVPRTSRHAVDVCTEQNKKDKLQPHYYIYLFALIKKNPEYANIFHLKSLTTSQKMSPTLLFNPFSLNVRWKLTVSTSHSCKGNIGPGLASQLFVMQWEGRAHVFCLFLLIYLRIKLIHNTVKDCQD